MKREKCYLSECIYQTFIGKLIKDIAIEWIIEFHVGKSTEELKREIKR
jgi:hypothetical protein